MTKRISGLQKATASPWRLLRMGYHLILNSVTPHLKLCRICVNYMSAYFAIFIHVPIHSNVFAYLLPESKFIQFVLRVLNSF